MDGTLKLTSNTLAYADAGTTNNPLKKFTDWGVQRSYAVKNPKAEPFTVAPGATLAIFSGTRSTAVDGTTQFTLTLSTLASDRYRFTHSAGTAPALRTNRNLALSGSTVTIAINANQTATMTTALGGGFTAVVVGDTVFLPGTTTGDSASPFNILNEGYWVVLDKTSSTVLQLGRLSGQDFVGADDAAISVTANSQVQAFSSDGVQVGDGVVISAGFAAAIQKKYTVVAVNPSWFEVVSTSALPIGAVAIPGAAGIQFYSYAKRYVRVEADQECVVRLNGDTGDSNRLSPWVAAEPDHTAFYEKVGPCWSATVVNKSSEQLNILFISAE